ncbi:MBL fold metallo-hydrolase [uncultured Oscillibacter sp.]|uniref:MBL fold metallo-hydrolase n=1 Tax=uncultured Oscillibacter sp. TaxID=876091 RepID=UPI0025E493C5|nr:MBL fold metallo-hydrolase [uncultured Oscillibacter sp.]
MMTVTFLGHSGFLAELPTVTLLFDWWKGELPALRPGVPLYVFASHRHEDHFDPKIFALDGGPRDVRFVLGHDIKLSIRNLERWGVSPGTAEKCHILRGGQTCTLPQATVEALSSTDEGEAFLVKADGLTLFHAGDLNWWHWEGEDKAWNNNMAANFQRYTEPLRGRRIDLAMLPLDPRLGEDGFRGPRHFLETADICHFLPMHQWGDFGFTEKFLARCPEFRPQTVPVTEEGQGFSL